MILLGWLYVVKYATVPALIVGYLVAYFRVPPHIAFALLIALAFIAGYGFSVHSFSAPEEVLGHLGMASYLFVPPLLVSLFIGFVIGFKKRNRSNPPADK